MATKQRAEPLAPDKRREAILQAVIPLLLDQGGTVTTAQMAEAAGVAEGTIFRVFPDKTAVVHDAIRTSLDPTPVLELLDAIERNLPLAIKLRKAAAIVLQRAERVHALIAVLKTMPAPRPALFRETHRTFLQANSLILGGLTRLFENEAPNLAVEPARAAAAFRGLLHSVSFPMCDPNELITAEEAIEILINGVRVRRNSAA